MHRTQDPGTTSPTDSTQGVNKHSGLELTENGNADTRYRRLMHRRCASLDLETAFKQINISQDIKPEVCPQCHTQQCRCPAFMPEMPCSSASSMHTPSNSDQEDIPELVDHKQVHILYPPNQSPSNEEANREVAAICSTTVYYWVRSRLTRRCRYYMYNALDSIDEPSRDKRRC